MPEVVAGNRLRRLARAAHTARMSSTRTAKYPACSLSLEGLPAFSFSKASTTYHVTKACVEHLAARLFPEGAPAKPAPAGHEADLETVYQALVAQRDAAESPEAAEPVVQIRVYRGELDGIWPVTLQPGLDFNAVVDELLYWRRNGASNQKSKLQRTSGRKGYHCAATARLAWGTPNPRPGT